MARQHSVLGCSATFIAGIALHYFIFGRSSALLAANAFHDPIVLDYCSATHLAAKMLHITCYLLTLGMVLTTVMCEGRQLRVEWGIGYQCQDRGYNAGACQSQNEHQGELVCSSLACALGSGEGRYIVSYTKPVEDGTPCGHKKICVNGNCVLGHPSKIELVYDSGNVVDCVSRRRMVKHRMSLYKNSLINKCSSPNEPSISSHGE